MRKEIGNDRRCRRQQITPDWRSLRSFKPFRGFANLGTVIYRHREGRPASVWELMNDPDLIERHWRGESTLYTTVDQFRGAAISNYFIWRWREYDYTVNGINDYYRSILEMSIKGWPGGLRWLHGEDKLLFEA